MQALETDFPNDNLGHGLQINEQKKTKWAILF